jgi:hypothetical protein
MLSNGCSFAVQAPAIGFGGVLGVYLLAVAVRFGVWVFTPAKQRNRARRELLERQRLNELRHNLVELYRKGEGDRNAERSVELARQGLESWIAELQVQFERAELAWWFDMYKLATGPHDMSLDQVSEIQTAYDTRLATLRPLLDRDHALYRAVNN